MVSALADTAVPVASDGTALGVITVRRSEARSEAGLTTVRPAWSLCSVISPSAPPA